jgi:hypothetical protein
MVVICLSFKEYVIEQYNNGTQNQAMKQKKQNATRQQDRG